MPKRQFPPHIFERTVDVKKEFFGSSPPSVFVGRYGYPNIFTGILSPTDSFKEAMILDSPELWYENKIDISQVLALRRQMVYSRFATNIKKHSGKLAELQQELIQSSKPCDVEIRLKKNPRPSLRYHGFSPPIGNPALIESARLAENPKILKKVDKVVSDTDLKAVGGMIEMYMGGIPISNIQKILSVGLLGLKRNRKLVPTRWSITATDDTIGEKLLQKIRYYPELSEYLLFSNTYLGNHYQILFIPRFWSYELIEVEIPRFKFQLLKNPTFWIDREGYQRRKTYAQSCAGGYYAARLGICEYLQRIRRQASVFVLREVHPTYNTPLGVWVCRETVRGAFQNKPERFSSLDEALQRIDKNSQLPLSKLGEKSKLLKEIRVQRTLRGF